MRKCANCYFCSTNAIVLQYKWYFFVVQYKFFGMQEKKNWALISDFCRKFDALWHESVAFFYWGGGIKASLWTACCCQKGQILKKRSTNWWWIFLTAAAVLGIAFTPPPLLKTDEKCCQKARYGFAECNFQNSDKKYSTYGVHTKQFFLP